MTSYPESYPDQEEIRQIMDAMNPAFFGHSRAVGLLALIRMMAVMLGPASTKTRADVIERIPLVINGILDEMDHLKADLDAD